MLMVLMFFSNGFSQCQCVHTLHGFKHLHHVCDTNCFSNGLNIRLKFSLCNVGSHGFNCFIVLNMGLLVLICFQICFQFFCVGFPCGCYCVNGVHCCRIGLYGFMDSTLGS